MPVYRVTLTAEGMRVAFDGAEVMCGFYKNEFVWAKTSEQAVDRAHAKTMAALRQNPAVNKADLASVSLKLHTIQAGSGLINLPQRQGFIFYKLDAEREDAEAARRRGVRVGPTAHE